MISGYCFYPFLVLEISFHIGKKISKMKTRSDVVYCSHSGIRVGEDIGPGHYKPLSVCEWCLSQPPLIKRH